MKNNYIPPYSTILIFISLINIIFSTYFITILLVGVVFKIFLESLKKGYYYIFTFVIITFMIIETAQGFQLFSLTLVSLFLYYFIIPKIKHLFSSSILAEFIFMISFYLSAFILVLFNETFELKILLVFLGNFVLDSLIVGLFL